MSKIKLIPKNISGAAILRLLEKSGRNLETLTKPLLKNLSRSHPNVYNKLIDLKNTPTLPISIPKTTRIIKYGKKPSWYTETTLQGNVTSPEMKLLLKGTMDFGRIHVINKPHLYLRTLLNGSTLRIWVGDVPKNLISDPSVLLLKYLSYEPVMGKGRRRGDINTVLFRDFNLEDAEIPSLLESLTGVSHDIRTPSELELALLPKINNWATNIRPALEI